MADRPNVKDILAKARATQAAGTPEPAAAAAPSPAPKAAAAPAPSAPAVPTGRPLTLKEKLAAAKANSAPAAPASAAVESAPVAAPAATTAAPAVKAPTAAELGRPLTLKEKLAAAKAIAGATGSAPTAAAAPAAAKPVAAARTLPPLSEMNDPKDLAEALRQTAAKPAPAKAAAAVKPAAKKEGLNLPPRPNKNAAMAALQGTRRRFMIGAIPATAWLVIAWTTFSAALVAFSAMLGRFFFPNVLAEPPSTINVGPSSQFEPGEVNERWKAEWGFWIVRSVFNGQDSIYALSTICTHLGCPPNWLASEQKFKCPCHGSGFYVSGVNFEGPAPRPLERFKLSVGDDGQIVVDKAQKYQEELGQWNDPDSFIPV